MLPRTTREVNPPTGRGSVTGGDAPAGSSSPSLIGSIIAALGSLTDYRQFFSGHNKAREQPRAGPTSELV